MITILFIIAFLVYSYGIVRNCGISSIFPYTFISGVVYFILFLVCSLFFPTKSTNYYYEIASLRNENSISGSFILGSGSIESQEKYLFFSKNGNEYQRAWLYTNKVAIVENNDISPRVTFDRVVAILPKWFSPFSVELEKGDTNYKIIVPKNTIIQQYKLN